METTDLDIDDVTPRIRDQREWQERLEASAEEARAILSQRMEVLDDVETITAYARDLSVFLTESELTERRAFVETVVKEIVVMPGNALMRYTIPMPDDSLIPGRVAEKVALNGSVHRDRYVEQVRVSMKLKRDAMPGRRILRRGFFLGGRRGAALRRPHKE